MVVNLITFKAERNFINDVDKAVKMGGFHNRTEFIREALRDKMSEVEKKKAIEMLIKLKGRGNPKDALTEEEYERIRSQDFNGLGSELEEAFRKL